MAIDSSTGSPTLGVWARWLLPGVFALLVGVIAGHYLGIGLATHGDSRSVIEGSVPAILRGSYFRSRSFGNPLYEYAAALMYPAGGVLWLSLYSLVSAIASIFIFNRLLGPTVAVSARTFAIAALCLNPLFLINAFAVTEWSQVVLILVLLLWCAREWTISSRTAPMLGIALFSALLVLTRPDAGIVCFGVCAAVLWQIRLDWKRSVRLLLALALAGGVTIAVFVTINHGLDFLRTGVNYATAPYWRRAIVASVGVYSTLGPIAAVITAVVAAGLLARIADLPHDAGSFWARVFLVTVPIVLLRFLALPDKLEYILYLLVLAILTVVHQRVKPLWLGLFALSSVLPSLLTLSLFERVGVTDHLSVHPRIGPGAVIQDARAIAYNWRLMRDPALLAKIGDAAYGTTATEHPHLRSENWATGLLSDTGDLVIGRPEAYHLDNARDDSVKNSRRAYSHVYVCDRSVWVNGSYGWRLAEPAIVWPDFDDPSGSLELHCQPE